MIKKPQPDNAGKIEASSELSQSVIIIFFPEFFLTQITESCLAILNNKYNDSVAWVSWSNILRIPNEISNIPLNISYSSNVSTMLVSWFYNFKNSVRLFRISACYHRHGFICEDSKQLLDEI